MAVMSSNHGTASELYHDLVDPVKLTWCELANKETSIVRGLASTLSRDAQMLRALMVDWLSRHSDARLTSLVDASMHTAVTYVDRALMLAPSILDDQRAAQLLVGSAMSLAAKWEEYEFIASKDISHAAAGVISATQVAAASDSLAFDLHCDLRVTTPHHFLSAWLHEERVMYNTNSGTGVMTTEEERLLAGFLLEVSLYFVVTCAHGADVRAAAALCLARATVRLKRHATLAPTVSVGMAASSVTHGCSDGAGAAAAASLLPAEAVPTVGAMCATAWPPHLAGITGCAVGSLLACMQYMTADHSALIQPAVPPSIDAKTMKTSPSKWAANIAGRGMGGDIGGRGATRQDTPRPGGKSQLVKTASSAAPPASLKRKRSVSRGSDSTQTRVQAVAGAAAGGSSGTAGSGPSRAPADSTLPAAPASMIAVYAKYSTSSRRNVAQRFPRVGSAFEAIHLDWCNGAAAGLVPLVSAAASAQSSSALSVPIGPAVNGADAGEATRSTRATSSHEVSEADIEISAIAGGQGALPEASSAASLPPVGDKAPTKSLTSGRPPVPPTGTTALPPVPLRRQPTVEGCMPRLRRRLLDPAPSISTNADKSDTVTGAAGAAVGSTQAAGCMPRLRRRLLDPAQSSSVSADERDTGATAAAVTSNEPLWLSSLSHAGKESLQPKRPSSRELRPRKGTLLKDASADVNTAEVRTGAVPSVTAAAHPARTKRVNSESSDVEGAPTRTVSAPQPPLALPPLRGVPTHHEPSRRTAAQEAILKMATSKRQ